MTQRAALRPPEIEKGPGFVSNYSQHIDPYVSPPYDVKVWPYDQDPKWNLNIVVPTDEQCVERVLELKKEYEQLKNRAACTDCGGCLGEEEMKRLKQLQNLLGKI